MSTRTNQCQKPTGWVGQFIAWNMNARHSKLTDWGLSYVSIGKLDIILDVGCGGGRTVSKLASLANEGKVYGIDFSKASIAVARRMNKQWLHAGRVEIQEGSVSELPFPASTFDLVTAVETHFWWPDLPADVREILRVLKPGARLVMIAEIYKGAKTMAAQLAEKYLPLSGMTLLSVSEHRQLFEDAGFVDVTVMEDARRGWICAIGNKPKE
jgi:SAM-dependent methyltransferase